MARSSNSTRSLRDNGQADKIKESGRNFTGAPSYYDQIWTSIKTVFFGFLIASAIAIPLGIAAGLSTLRQRRAQPAHPDLQTGLAAGLACRS